MFLSKTELRELTGYIRPSRQVRWLQQQGLCYALAADGYPRVLKNHLLAVLTDNKGGLTNK